MRISGRPVFLLTGEVSHRFTCPSANQGLHNLPFPLLFPFFPSTIFFVHVYGWQLFVTILFIWKNTFTITPVLFKFWIQFYSLSTHNTSTALSFPTTPCHFLMPLPNLRGRAWGEMSFLAKCVLRTESEAQSLRRGAPAQTLPVSRHRPGAMPLWEHSWCRLQDHLS